MDDHERYRQDNLRVDAIAEECASIGVRIAAQEAQMIRRLAEAWDLAEEQTSRIASADSRRRDMPLRCIAAQISVETRMNDRTLQKKMYDAWRLVSHFAASVVAMETGRITKAHAEAILDAGAALEDQDVRAAFEQVVIEWAASETVARTRAYARRLAEKLDARTVHERHADAADERSITVVDLDAGMSQIIALVPTVYARAVLDRLTRQARQIKEVDLSARRSAREAARAAHPGLDVEPAEGVSAAFDDRSADQVRADVFVDTLLTGAPAIDPTADRYPGGLGAIRAQVQITMPITTLTGVTQGGAEIDGKAPIDPETARRLAGATRVWDRVMYDPVTAVVVTVDRYQPSPAQRRLLEARDRHCRFPGCRMPARRCQVDHNREHHEGGPTSVDNLACLCVRHHTMKTETEWTVRQSTGGRLVWSSPTGRAYVDEPARVVFVPSLDPAPF